ncbi:hypothetical protein HYC85_007491 [Camellia sinensis]|uniref:Uncharacterized protein n=1 Tax=Camellia sinensis TaxID=4442 RepID=A0A7J7HPY5_CAMSI|nr:hypothetical protein HYC85_007491 [Camellia sinensis]
MYSGAHSKKKYQRIHHCIHGGFLGESSLFSSKPSNLFVLAEYSEEKSLSKQ